YANRLELVTQTKTDQGALVVVIEVHVLSIRTDSVHVGALGQVVSVANAVRVLLLVTTCRFPRIRHVGRIGHRPRGHHLASTQRSGQADHVRVDLQTLDGAVSRAATAGNGLTSEDTILRLTG